MRKAIRWTKRARQRLDEVGAYIARDNPAAAGRTVSAIALAISRLGQAPARGRPGRLDGTRELVVPRTPYLIAYRVHASDIEILTIQHGAQPWPDAL